MYYKLVDSNRKDINKQHITLSIEEYKKLLEKKNSFNYFNNPYQRTLKQLGVKTNMDGNLIATTVSRFSKEYYEFFADKSVLTLINDNPTAPFYLVIDKDSVSASYQHDQKEISHNSKGISSGKHRRIWINYETDMEYKQVYALLTDIDKDILLFIAIFRNVQFLQIIRELGLPSHRCKKSLERLNTYGLIDKFEFVRDFSISDEEMTDSNQTAKSYGITANGTIMLLLEKVISNSLAYKWKELQRYEDNYAPIRHWKVVDAYQEFRLNENYSNYRPYPYLMPFEYEQQIFTSKKEIEKKKYSVAEKALGYDKETEKQSKTHKIIRRVPGFRFEGQIEFRDKNGSVTRFDLYPYITEKKEDNRRSDLERLGIVFEHYGRFKNGIDSNGDRRMLLLVVDSSEQIITIDNEYSLRGTNGNANSYKNLRNIVFLNLDKIQNNNLLAALETIVVTDGKKEIKTVAFTLDNIFNNESNSR